MAQDADCNSAVCHNAKYVQQRVSLLNVVLMSVVMLVVILLRAVILNVIQLSGCTLNVIQPSVLMLIVGISVLVECLSAELCWM